MSAEKTCCFTGHRRLPPEKLDYIKNELSKEIRAAVEDGYTRFISGFAEGADILCAEIALELQKQYPSICLEAAIPYRNRLERLLKDERSKRLIEGCAGVAVLSDKYIASCYQARNRYMVQSAGRCIAVYDGRPKGGTAFTICYANAFGRDVRIIFV